MGINNAMTEQKYKALKADLNAALKSEKYAKLETLDKEVTRKHGFSISTGRNVRNTKNYQEYQERVFRFHGNPAKRCVPSVRVGDVGTRAKDPRDCEKDLLDCDDEKTINPILVGIADIQHRDRKEWLIVLLITLFGLIVVEAAIIVLFWSKYVD